MSSQSKKSFQDLISRGRERLRRGERETGLADFFTAAGNLVIAGELGKAAAVYKMILRKEAANPLALALLNAIYHDQGLSAEARHLRQAVTTADSGDDIDTRRLRTAIAPLFTSPGKPGREWLNAIIKLFSRHGFAPGELLLREGENNRNLFVLLEGRLAVSCHDRRPGGEIPLAILETGDFFGEYSLLTGQPAGASVRALTAGRLAQLQAFELDRLALHFPGLLQRLTTAFKERKLQLLKHKLGRAGISLERKADL